jgi:hypothetical protein
MHIALEEATVPMLHVNSNTHSQDFLPIPAAAS